VGDDEYRKGRPVNAHKPFCFLNIFAKYLISISNNMSLSLAELRVWVMTHTGMPSTTFLSLSRPHLKQPVEEPFAKVLYGIVATVPHLH
jgi:hypothetical protein